MDITKFDKEMTLDKVADLIEKNIKKPKGESVILHYDDENDEGKFYFYWVIKVDQNDDWRATYEIIHPNKIQSLIKRNKILAAFE